MGGGWDEHRAEGRLRDAFAHDDAADRHMKAAELWRDIGQVQRAVLEVKFAMAERQLAQLERDRATLETVSDGAVGSPAIAEVSYATAASPHEHTGTTEGAVEVLYADDRWHVVWDGEPGSDSVHQFRIAAVVVAHERARRARCDLLIRGRDGDTREHVSYRDDPIRQRILYRRPELRRA
jgi:hypothetical protein